jgi:hypothetical protein
MPLSLVPDEHPTIPITLRTRAVKNRVDRPRVTALSVMACVLSACGVILLGLGIFALSAVHIPAMARIAAVNASWLAIVGLVFFASRDYMERRHNQTVISLSACHAKQIAGVHTEMQSMDQKHSVELIDIRRQLAMLRAEGTAQMDEHHRELVALLAKLPGFVTTEVERRVTDVQADQILHRPRVPEQPKPAIHAVR